MKLCSSDYRFMCVVWDNEPIHSGELVKKCDELLGWKKSTTYTMVKKMSGKGYLKNDNSIVSSLIDKGSVQASESEYIVNNTFGGSLPAFIASFMNGKKLAAKEADELKQLINKLSEE